LLEGGDDVAEVVEAFAALGQPIRVDARPFERFDQLLLWAAAVEREPERPLGRATVVFPALSLRPEDPSAPRPGGEPRIEHAHRTFEVADDERDLKGRKPIERRDHGRNLRGNHDWGAMISGPS
jgi:hypothetical protein